MDRRITNPLDSNDYRNKCNDLQTTLKGSNVYRKNQWLGYTTPSGSHPFYVMFSYKHQIPSGLLETNSTLKGSYVYRNGCGGFFATLKGSNIYRDDIACFHSTPSESHNSSVINIYKHQIPSGLETKIYVTK